MGFLFFSSVFARFVLRRIGFDLNCTAEAHRVPESHARVEEPLQAVVELEDLQAHQERDRAHGLGARCDGPQAGDAPARPTRKT